jgi:hypothetical protein
MSQERTRMGASYRVAVHGKWDQNFGDREEALRCAREMALPDRITYVAMRRGLRLKLIAVFPDSKAEEGRRLWRLRDTWTSSEDESWDEVRNKVLERHPRMVAFSDRFFSRLGALLDRNRALGGAIFWGLLVVIFAGLIALCYFGYYRT